VGVGIPLVFDREVLTRAPLGPVIDADNDEGWDAAPPHEALRRVGDTPGRTRERPRRIEQVLAVVQVQHRQRRRLPATRARREPDRDAAREPKVETGDLVRDEHATR
jgi:hypothetical protein